MSNLVEIKAEGLKWCPNWFSFSVVGGSQICRLMHWCHDRPRFCTFDKSTGKKVNSGAFIFPKDSILVNPEEYEKAVVERIKEMIDHTVISINKKILPFDKTPTVWVRYKEKKTVCADTVDIKADPRPWENEYVIHVGPQ